MGFYLTLVNFILALARTILDCSQDFGRELTVKRCKDKDVVVPTTPNLVTGKEVIASTFTVALVVVITTM